jgi:hypothetical protein
MRDRVPTQILPNGAIRYAVYDASGNFQRYDYMLPADEPSEDGTALNKANLFRDATALAYGFTADAVPDDALLKLANAAFIRRIPLTVKRGGPVSSFTEGSTIYLPEEGTACPFIFSKRNYEPELNGNGRGLMVRRDAPYAARWGANNTFVTSDIDAWMRAYPNKFPVEMQDAMGQTTIRYTPMGGVNTVQTIQRKAFPLSGAEYGLSSSYINVEGTALPNAATLRIAKDGNGNITPHAIRSPVITNSNEVMAVTSSGTLNGAVVTDSRSYRPAFTLPEDLEVYWYEDAAGNVYAEAQYDNSVETALGHELGNFLYMESYEYTGTGVTGSASPNVLITGFRPQVIMIGTKTTPTAFWPVLAQRGQTNMSIQPNTGSPVSFIWGVDRVSWYSAAVQSQHNVAGQQYYCTVLGLSAQGGS